MTTSNKKSLLLLTGIFVLSRLLFYLAGIRYDAGTLECFFQILDVQLLRHDLLRSIFYLHSQPPLFNLGIGLVLKAFPGNEVTAFAVIAMLLGVILTWSMFLLMIRLGVSRVIALVVTVVVIIGPQSILYENWLYYTYAVAALMALSALLLHLYLTTGRLRDGVIFFMMLSLVILTRSLFHLAWMLVVVASLIYYRRSQWRQILLAAFLPLLLVVSLYVKNAVVAGSFASSTWMGMNLSRKTTFLMPVEMRKEEVRRGELSPLALIGPFSGLSAYDHIPYRRTHTGIPALDQIWKAEGCPNLNNLAYAELSRGYLADAKHIITAHPEIYLRGCALGFFTYALPSSNYYFLEKNRRMIPAYERIYNLLIFGQLLPFEAAPLDEQAEGYTGKKLLIRGWFLVIGLPILVWYGFRRARRAAPSAAAASAFSVTLYFLLGTIAYVTIVGNAIEVSENNRFRFTIEPYIAMLAALALTRLWQRLRSRGTSETLA